MVQNKHYVIIGAGNIGRILVRRLEAAGVPSKNLAICDADPEHLDRAAREFGVRPVSLFADQPCSADAVLIATPPESVAEVLRTLASRLHAGQVVVSFASATPLARLEELVPPGVCVARVITNVASMVGAGVNPVAYGACVGDEARALVASIMAVLGDSIAVRDDQMNWCFALTGAAVRSVLPVMEGLTQAGLEAGLSLDDARRIAAEVLHGAAELVMRADLTLNELKALTPVYGLDDRAVAGMFRDAAYAAKEKADQNEHRLFG